MKVELGAQVPAWLWDVSPSAIREWAQAVESAGYDFVFVTDHVTFAYPLHERPAAGYGGAVIQHEALTMLAFVAACTSRVALHTSVLVVPQREPVLLAKQVAEVDVLSGGRLRLGIGAGWNAVEFGAMGAEFGNRGRRTDEAIGVMRACWTQEPVSFEGRWTRMREMSVLPKPARPGGPPILVGGSSPAAERRAVTLGDGWMGMGFVRPDQAGEQIARLRDHRPDLLVQWTTMLRDFDRTSERLNAYRDLGATLLGVSMPEREPEATVGRYLQRLEEFARDFRR